MPYSVGAKGTGGCKNGYPVIKTATGEVIACHATRASAEDQIAAININETKMDWSITPTQTKAEAAIYPNVGVKTPTQGRAGGTTGSGIKSKYGEKPKKNRKGRSPDALGSNGAIATTSGTSMGTKSDDNIDELEQLAKESPCWDGYVQQGMKPGDGGAMVPNCVPVKKYHDALMMMKAENGYTPTGGMKAAARKAIKFKEDGKANGAGTAVGWTRAHQLASGEPLSLDTVKRMYSFFSRHEVDKKGKDWGNQSNPSNGYIMWLAWGGDAGFAWSRAIVERETKKFWEGSAFSAE
jgi:hypothetical protein